MGASVYTVSSLPGCHKQINKISVDVTGSYGNSSSTPKSRGALPEKARRRNEACFGEAAHPALDRDFDFEGNLALFDKRALWEQMNNAHKPDLVRQVTTGTGTLDRHFHSTFVGMSIDVRIPVHS